MIGFVKWAWCVLFHPPLEARRGSSGVWLLCPKCGNPYHMIRRGER